MTNTELTPGAVLGNYTELLFDGYRVALRGNKTGKVFEVCKRCGGDGEYSFNLQDGTVCYGCYGRRIGAETTEAEVVRKYVAREKARARARAKEDARIAKFRADMDEWQAANAEIIEALRPFLPVVDEEGYTDFSAPVRNKFLASIADQAILTVNPLSEKQIVAARNALAKQAERDGERAAKTAQKAAVGHYGKVGDKVEVAVKVVRCTPFDGEYGTRWLITMETTEGHTVKTWTTGNFVSDAIDAEKSKEVITIKATVKAHGEYNGIPEATLLRVKKV